MASGRFQSAAGLAPHEEEPRGRSDSSGGSDADLSSGAVEPEPHPEREQEDPPGQAPASESEASSRAGNAACDPLGSGEDVPTASPAIAVEPPFPRLASVKDPIEPRTMADLALKAMAQVAHDLYHLNTVDLHWLSSELMKLGLFERPDTDEPDSEAASGASSEPLPAGGLGSSPSSPAAPVALDPGQPWPWPASSCGGGGSGNLPVTPSGAAGNTASRKDGRPAPGLRSLRQSMGSRGSLGLAELRKRFSSHYGLREEAHPASGAHAGGSMAAGGPGTGPAAGGGEWASCGDSGRSFRRDRRLTLGNHHSMANSSEISRMADAFINSGRRIELGFGLHFGWAIEGAVGSTLKIDVTYLSPHVNLAARLESLTKQYKIRLLMSSAFHRRLSSQVQSACRCLDRVTVKGSSEPISIFTYDFWEALPAVQQQQQQRQRSAPTPPHLQPSLASSAGMPEDPPHRDDRALRASGADRG